MKALLYEQHGGPEVLQYRTVPDPEPGPRDAVIKVALTTINRLDAVQRNGWFTVPGFSLPHISGMDVAGEVVEIGAQVTRVKPGDRVLVNPSMAEAPEGSKLAGMDDLYGELGVIGSTLPGGYAEQCLAPEPTCTPSRTICNGGAQWCSPTCWMTSHHALFEVGRLKPARRC